MVANTYKVTLMMISIVIHMAKSSRQNTISAPSRSFPQKVLIGCKMVGDWI